MRTMLIFLLLLASHRALAVVTSNCPPNIEISYQDLIPVSEERIERLRRHSNPEVYRVATQARSAIIRSTAEDLTGLAHSYEKAQRGKCIYSATSGNGAIEIFTRQGEDFMRVTLPFRGLQIHTSHSLSKVETDGITVDYRPATPLFVRVGASSYQIGWAYGLDL